MKIRTFGVSPSIHFSLLFIPLLVLLSGTPGFTEEGKGDRSVRSEQGGGLERLMMGGTEIQGTVEKPHVVYVVPWKDDTSLSQQDISFERSFREEILEPVDRARFQRKWGNDPRTLKGGR
ncbi:MAG: hypothetical protein ACE5FZ_02535 [Nitrospiria bacterium]